jgi:hypothetical protein
VRTAVSTTDADARRGLRLSLLGVLGIFLTAGLLAVVPSGAARVVAYLLGLAAIAAISVLGGFTGRRALNDGTALRGRALTATIVGLWLGLTAAVLCFWTLVAVAL